MKKWKMFTGYNGIPRIAVDNEESTPIARLSVYTDWASNPEIKERTLKNGTCMAASPTMYNALLKVKEVMDLEVGTPDIDQLYDIVKNAIKEATYENQEAKS